MHGERIARNDDVAVTDDRGKVPDFVLAPGIEEWYGRRSLERLVASALGRTAEQQEL